MKHHDIEKQAGVVRNMLLCDIASLNKNIDVIEGYEDLVKKEASPLEIIQFTHRQGFVSEKHIKLWLEANYEYCELRSKMKNSIKSEEIAKMQEQLDELEDKIQSIRDSTYFVTNYVRNSRAS